MECIFWGGGGWGKVAGYLLKRGQLCVGGWGGGGGGRRGEWVDVKTRGQFFSFLP